MSPGRLLLRSLSYHRAVHVAVALGVAVGAAVLAGALIVGDSVRGSLRDLTLDRLGKIDQALVADRYVREALADDLGAVPAILIRGTAENPGSGSRASRINIHGVDERFWGLYESDIEQPGSREVLVNQSLASELGVEADGTILLRFQTDTLVPSESVMGRKTDNVRTLRLKVARVIEDRGPGRFGLSPSQQLPLNAFLPMAAVQRALEQEGRVNALFGAGSGDLNGSLAVEIQLDDVEIDVLSLEDSEVLSVQTGRIVLEATAAEAARRAAGDRATDVLTYLANTMTVGDRSVPYSTVTAIGSGELVLSGDEIIINDWAARDLRAEVGDELKMSYFVVGRQGALDTETHNFRIKAVVRLRGLAADRNLAPEYKGMSNVERMGDWDPPFPVDLGLIRPIDEDYWDRYRTAPKAFVSLGRAKQLWSSRFGQLTSVRVSPKAGQSLSDAETEFAEALRGSIDPAAFGLAFRPVKQDGLDASSGATDFSGLFFGFSMFLIASAAMLVSLLFRLGVERRSKEIGLLFATGQRTSTVRRLLLGEGALLAAIGCLIGVPGAIAYGWLMVYGLSTWWSAAVGGSFLELHVSGASLAGGLVGAFLLMLYSIWTAVRRVQKTSPRTLLAGGFEQRSDIDDPKRARRPRMLGWLAGSLAIGLLIVGSLGDSSSVAGAFFGVAALSLIAVLAFFRAGLLSPAKTKLSDNPSLGRLGARNGRRFPTRSVLSAGLVASATFVIVTVAVNRHDVKLQEPEFLSGDGGFRLIAESDTPLHQDQLNEDAVPAMTPFRVQPGEDASCLNLYQPTKPTLLGAPRSLIERGGFAFQATLAETAEEQANPWVLLDKKFPGDAIPVFGDMNSVMWILHKGLGQTLEVDDEQGNKRQLIIAGLMTRSIFQSQLIMAEDRFLELNPSRGGFNLFLVETDSAEVGATLEQRWADWGFDATGTADRLAGYLVVENTYLSTFQTLGGLGLLLGTLGLAVVMVRNVVERRGELALLQAVGFSEKAVSKVVFSENAFLLVFGVAAGAMTALLAVAPHLLSGLAHPPWVSLGLTLAGIVAVGLVVGAIAVRASLRQPILSGLSRD